MVGTGSVWDGRMNRIVIGRTPDAENLTPAQTVEMKDRLMPSLPLTSMSQYTLRGKPQGRLSDKNSLSSELSPFRRACFFSPPRTSAYTTTAVH